MALQLFLNDLSTPNAIIAAEVSVHLLKTLVSAVKAAKALDDGIILNSVQPISSLELGGATLAAVRNRGECVEESQYLKNLADRAPLKAALEAAGMDANDFEYRLKAAAPILPTALADALGLAHRLDGLAISLATHSCWELAHVPLDLAELTPSGTIQTSDVSARNASNAADIEVHRAALEEALRPTLLGGADLWERRAILLPHLDFIPRVKSQLEDIEPTNPLLPAIWYKLSGINSAISIWTALKTQYPTFPFYVRPESGTRIREGLVNFSDSTGSTRTFSDHTDLSPGEWRLHFIVQAAPKRHALIGHVGRKLGIG